VCKTPFEQGGYPTGSAVRRPTTFRLTRALLWLAVVSGSLSCEAVRAAPESPSLNEYVYPGDDLGAVYSPQATTIKVWAPTAKNASVVLFADATGQDSASIPMSRDPEGIWSATLEGDQDGKYYLLEITHHKAGADKATVYRVNDPYARNNGITGTATH